VVRCQHQRGNGPYGWALVDLALLLPVGWLSDRLDYRVVLAPALLLMALVLAWFPRHRACGVVLVSIGIHTSFAAWGMPSAALAQLARGSGCAAPWGVSFWSMGRSWWLRGHRHTGRALWL
jgi:hypothetical protein